MEYKDYDVEAKLTNNIYEIPLTAYFKYAPKDIKFNFWGGAGVTVGHVKWEDESLVSSNSETKSNTLVYPHIAAGIEWRPNKIFGLGLDAAYKFGGNYKLLGVLKRDVSGFEGFLAARFYFL